MNELFDNINIETYFANIDNHIEKKLQIYCTQELMEKDFESIANLIFKEFKIVPLELDKDSTTSNISLLPRPGNSFPLDTDVRSNKTYNVAVVTYSISFKGDSDLFSVIPKKYSPNRPFGYLQENKLHIPIKTEYRIIDIPDSVIEQVKRGFKQIYSSFESLLSQINQECEVYNNGIKERVITTLSQYLENRRKMNQLKSKLNPFN